MSRERSEAEARRLLGQPKPPWTVPPNPRTDRNQGLYVQQYGRGLRDTSKKPPVRLGKISRRLRINWGAVLWTVVSWLSIAFVGALLVESFIRNS